MRKIGKALASGLLATLLLASALPVSAFNIGDMATNDKNYKPFFNFDNVPEVYPNGYKIGSVTDRIGISKNRKCALITGVGISQDVTVKSGIGVSGNAVEYDISTNAPKEGQWCPSDFHMDNSKNNFLKYSNFDGATDFVFYLDRSKDFDKTYGDTWNRGMGIVIQETDYDAAGKMTKNATAWKVKNAGEGGFIYIQDASGKFVKKATSDPKKNEGQNIMFTPPHYKGWVKIPISCFCHPDDGAIDVDNKFDLKQIQLMEIGFGCYASQGGSRMIIDELGFIGNFNKVAPPSSSKSSGTTSNKPGANTSSAGSAAGSSSTASGASSSNVSSSSSDASSTESTTSADSSLSSNAAQGTNGSANSSNHTWLIVLIVVLVLAAAGVGGFFIFKKVKKS